MENQELIPDWVSISQAEKILGIPRDSLVLYIQNGILPFLKNGTRYVININQANEVFCDLADMNRKDIQTEREHFPFNLKHITPEDSRRFQGQRVGTKRR